MALISTAKLLTPFQLTAAGLSIVMGSLGIWNFVKSSDDDPVSMKGKWTITLEPTESNVEGYVGEIYVYELNVFSKNGLYEGQGEQTLYNGKMAPSHWKINLQNIDASGDVTTVLFTVQSSNRPFDINMVLQAATDSPNTYSGTYSTPMAKTRGKAHVSIER